MWNITTYGRDHPGPELTAIELENFCFAVEPIKMWIYLNFLYSCVYVNFFSGAVLVYFAY